MSLARGPLDDFTLMALIIAVALSVVVRRVGLAARRRKVIEREARAEDLAELTGLGSLEDLQAAFGPPDMDRVWRHVTLADVLRARTPGGRLFAGGWLDLAALGIAALPAFIPISLAQVGPVLGFIIQAGLWVSQNRRDL